MKRNKKIEVIGYLRSNEDDQQVSAPYVNSEILASDNNVDISEEVIADNMSINEVNVMADNAQMEKTEAGIADTEPSDRSTVVNNDDIVSPVNDLVIAYVNYVKEKNRRA